MSYANDLHSEHQLHRLTQIDWRYLQRFAIFRDRPPRDDDPLISEEVRDAAVGERRVAVLGGDKLLDQGANRGRGRSAAGIGRDVAAEEIFELVSSARGEHVFLRGYA